jgi:hypothetical protein
MVGVTIYSKSIFIYIQIIVLLNHLANYSSPRKYLKKQRTRQIKNYFYSKSYSNPNITQSTLCAYAHKSYITAIHDVTEHKILFHK